MSRVTYRVGPKAAQTLYYAEEQASRINLPINTTTTINFATLGISQREAGRVFKKLRNERFSPWCRRGARNSFQPTYTFGFENTRNGVVYEDPDSEEHNTHVHWTMHIPSQLYWQFEGVLRRWVNEITGTANWPENALDLKQITYAGRSSRYPIKGAAPPDATRYGVPAEKIEPQGVIVGKRTGTSTNLGPSARRALDKKMKINRLKNMNVGRKKSLNTGYL
jgi:hypothetical protein